MAGALALILLINAALPAIGAWQAFGQSAYSVNTAFLLPSVGYAYGLVADAQYRVNAEQFRWSLLLTHDRVLHNLAIGRGFRSLTKTPESGLTDRRLAHVDAPDRHLPVARGALRLLVPVRGDGRR